MLNRNRFSPLAYLLLIIILMLMLAACSGDGEAIPSPDAIETVLAPLPTAESSETPNTPVPAPGAVPYTLRVQPADLVLDPACLDASDDFVLRSPAIPASGLEQGTTPVFCAVGAPVDSEVTFTLTGPEGIEHSYRSISEDVGGVGIAAVAPKLTAADLAGDYTLIASYNDGAATLEFAVAPASEPFIALNQPLEINPTLVRAGIGGLPADGVARFALYRLSPTGGDVAEWEGIYLIATTLQGDAEGRADIELDVSDLPPGPYLMLLVPPEVEFDDPAILDLADMGQLAVTAEIERGLSVAGAGSSGEGPSVAPQPASGEGELPEVIGVDLSDSSLPTCQLAAEPALQLWPSDGEIGDWWYGCAVGFAGDQTLNLVVTLPDASQSAWDLRTNASGAAPFRWYSTPGEGAGEYRVNVTSASGQKASLSWEIDAATRPHLLVFPHDVRTDVGGELNLSGFPADAEVEIGMYRLDEQGQGVRVKQWTTKVDERGAFKQGFEQAFALEDGEYMLVAQGGPLYDFPGINVSASAVDFFGYNTPLSERYDAYLLNLGRTAGQQIAAVATPVAEESATADSAAAAAVPPKTISLTEDNSLKPTCPDASGDGPAACVLPVTVPRGTFVYIPMHGYQPGEKLRVFVTPPGGGRVELPATADAEGFADVHWYALNDETLGQYAVSIRGGGNPVDSAFTITEPVQPSVVIQPRSPVAGTPVVVSGAGFVGKEDLVLARYRSQGATDGIVTFELVDSEKIKAGGIGGFQSTYRTTAGQDGNLFLIGVFRLNSTEPVAQAVYQVGQPLYLRYPFGWAQNAQGN